MKPIQDPSTLQAVKARIKAAKAKKIRTLGTKKTGLKKKSLGLAKPKTSAKEFTFSDDPKDWIPEDDDEDEIDETDDANLTPDEDDEEPVKPTKKGKGDKEANEYDDPSAIPISKLPWNEVTSFDNSAVFGGKDGEGGFLCLEELEGVDVEVVESLGGGKMIKFKSVSGELDKKVSKRAKPDVPFSKEESAKFINIDDFDESKEKPKPKEKPVPPQVKPVPAPTETEKPLNKRERAALKHLQAKAAAAGLPIPTTLPERLSNSKPVTTPTEPKESEAEVLDAPQTFAKSPHSEHVSSQIHAAWNKYRLHPAVLRGLSDLDFANPTDIQVKSLGAALDVTRKGNGGPSGRDVIGAAATGSGKTLAFGLPVIQFLAKRDEAEGVVVEKKDAADEDDLEDEKEAVVNTGEKKERVLRPCTALIMTPTRELAMQVTEHLKAVGKYTSAKIVPIVGGMSLQKQRRVLSHSPDIIVATPGRLWELAENDEMIRTSLKCIRFLILDEADRMLEQGHFRDLESILNAISLNREDEGAQIPNESFTKPKSRQTFVFSATLLPNPSTLSKKLASKKPEKVHAKGKGPATNLTEFLARLELNPHPEGPLYIQALTKTLMATGLTEARVEVLDEDKDAAVYYLLTRYPNGRTIVFVNSIDMVRRLCPVLQVCKIDAIGLHSEMQQRQRLRNLDKFRSSTGTVLIATDVAARGLDIPSVEHVIHFHLPRTTDLYVHRSGRTARAMKEGMSVALVGPAEVGVYKKICHALGKEDGIVEFPMDRGILALIKSRLALAKKIEAAEHKTDKAKHDKDWMKKAAEECDIILDDSDEDEEVAHRKKKITREGVTPKKSGTNEADLVSMKAKLAEMLAKPILPMGVSAAYVTSNANRNFASEMIASEKSDETIWKGNKKTRAVDDVNAKKKKQRVL
ncbi:DEAD-domain-containing protein [Rhizoclosmatium globosum]|uniref:ATP-dependent RNA helicase n=1 Tax=Rhizoclosmatium globosum TaxID=329046 RepID=A0A1Y2BTW2_9FUNG|nr:DEAD-domain-containing protein [Rhizoclosmatium globosum]|eukprot:ORY38134.1 DEAD-domain-containing protein [Rhizoclosmatium globosum]